MGQPTNGACTNSAWPTQCVQVEKMHSNTILEELTGTRKGCISSAGRYSRHMTYHDIYFLYRDTIAGNYIAI